MSYIDNLDKFLYCVSLFSENLASIPTTDLSDNTGIDIDELTEYLEELGNRGFVNNYDNGSYITLQGRLALENAKNEKPFKEEVKNKKLKKNWSITKIVAGVLNAVTIIGIAIWAQTSSNEKTKLEEEMKELNQIRNVEQINQKATIDSLKLIANEYLKITSKSFNQSYPIEIPQGTFIYELYFAEFEGRIKNSECRIIINGNKIIVKQTKTNLTGGKVLFSGFLLKHKYGKWILTDKKEDVNADEVGGCTEITTIDFDKKIIEWC